MGGSWGDLGGDLGGYGRVSKVPDDFCCVASVGLVPNVQNHTQTIGFPMVFVPFLQEEAVPMMAKYRSSGWRN